MIKLTETEKKLIAFICKDGIGINSIQELADKLCVTRSTVVTHLQHLYRKFDVHSMAALIYKCGTQGSLRKLHNTNAMTEHYLATQVLMTIIKECKSHCSITPITCTNIRCPYYKCFKVYRKAECWLKQQNLL